MSTPTWPRWAAVILFGKKALARDLPRRRRTGCRAGNLALRRKTDQHHLGAGQRQS